MLRGTPLCSGCAGGLLWASRRLQKSSKTMSLPWFIVRAALQGKLETQARKTCSGITNWKITTSGKPYIELLKDQKEDLVYLTADSEDTLEELDPKKLYIIGGLVDRNRHKNVCAYRAAEQVSCPLAHGKHASAEMTVASPISCRASVAWLLHERLQAGHTPAAAQANRCSGLAEPCPQPACCQQLHRGCRDATAWSHRQAVSPRGCSQGAGLLRMLSRSPG